MNMIIFTGIVKLSNHRMYWHPGTRNKLIANAIPVNRVSEMLRVIQFNENAHISPNQEDYNRCFKIQPAVDLFRKIFQSRVHVEANVLLDEQIVPFQRASS